MPNTEPGAFARTAPIWQDFETFLPAKPYAVDFPGQRLRILPRALAVKRRLLQYNEPWCIRWLPFDGDTPDAATSWERAGLPAPNVVAVNRENGHAHLLYALATPVVVGPNAKPGPERYAAAVERGMRRRLKADQGYAGLIAKNPLHPDWHAEWLAPTAYTLEALDCELRYEDKAPTPRLTHDAADGWIGRNVHVFDETRQRAYRSVREFKAGGGTLAAFEATVFKYATQVNNAITSITPLPPLSFREVRGIARSIAKWTWRNFSPARFSAVQSARGRRSGAVRCQTAMQKVEVVHEAAKAIAAQGQTASTRAIAAQTGIARQTVSRLLKAVPRTISDNKRPKGEAAGCGGAGGYAKPAGNDAARGGDRKGGRDSGAADGEMQ
jgi:hypothetical protein